MTAQGLVIMVHAIGRVVLPSLALPFLSAALIVATAPEARAGKPRIVSGSHQSRHVVHNHGKGKAHPVHPVHPRYSKPSTPSRHVSRDSHDRWRGHRDDRYHGSKHDHRNCRHHDHHRHEYHSYHRHDYYSPRLLLGLQVPAHHTHHVGCGHVAYYCERCHFHTTALQIFYDHVHLSHSVSVTTIPTFLAWSPLNLTFVFD